MTRTEHLLVKVAEECAEVAQRCSKALRFGLAEVQSGQLFNNIERLSHEYADLTAAISLLAKEPGVVLLAASDENLKIKCDRIEHYLQYSRSVGCLDEAVK